MTNRRSLYAMIQMYGIARDAPLKQTCGKFYFAASNNDAYILRESAFTAAAPVLPA